MHLFVRLRERFAVTIVPGVSGICGAWGAAETPMTWGDDVLVVLPATLPLDELTRRLALADAAVIMKIGRNFARAKAALVAAGMAERAIYVERATMAGERVMPLAEKQRRRRALFLDDPRARAGAAAVSGRVAIVGLGPGPAEWMTPEASAAIARGDRRRRLRALCRAPGAAARTSARTRATIASSSTAPASR